MLKRVVMLVLMSLFLVDTTCYARSLVPPIDKSVAHVMANTVVLVNRDEQFCSGVVGRDPSGKTYLYTAAHCCDYWAMGEVADRKIQKTNGHLIAVRGILEEYSGSDVCRVRMTNYGPATVTIKAYNGERDLMLVSAFPRYSYAERVQRVMVLGRSMRNDLMLIASGSPHPGESGSPIINMRGEVIAFVSGHYPDAPYPNMVISIFE